MRFKKKLHYALKYLALGLPLIALAFLYFRAPNDMITIIENNPINALFNQLLNVSPWYNSLIDIVGLELGSDVLSDYFLLYPLYIFWVYIIDMLLDIITWFPRFLHDLVWKGEEK